MNRFLGAFGLRLYRATSAGNFSLDFASVMSRLRARDVPVSTVIDIGASNGCWSEKARLFYPGARYHLIEANEIHAKNLQDYARRVSRTSFVIAAASDNVGEVYFDDRDEWGGAASHEATEIACKRVSCTTVDEEIVRNGLTGPYLLKLDTHGFEVPILHGAKRALQETNAIVMEVYNFHLTEQSLTFWEMCDYLQKRGFRPMDLMEPLHRPKDGAFWQMDIVFLKSDRPEFGDNDYA